MRHRLLPILAVPSLVLLLVVLFAWIRSYQTGDQLYWKRVALQADSGDEQASQVARRELFLMSGRGAFGVETRTQFLASSMATPAEIQRGSSTPFDFVWTTETPPAFGFGDDTFWQRLGFYYKVTNQGWGSATTNRDMRFPAWSAALTLGFLPGCWMIRAMRSRGRSGFCPHCGCGLQDGTSRCPECGTRIS